MVLHAACNAVPTLLKSNRSCVPWQIVFFQVTKTEAVEPGDILSLLQRLDLLFFGTQGLKEWIANDIDFFGGVGFGCGAKTKPSYQLV